MRTEDVLGFSTGGSPQWLKTVSEVGRGEWKPDWHELEGGESDGRCLFGWLWIGIGKRGAGSHRGKGRVMAYLHWQVFGHEELPVRVES